MYVPPHLLFHLPISAASTGFVVNGCYHKCVVLHTNKASWERLVSGANSILACGWTNQEHYEWLMHQLRWGLIGRKDQHAQRHTNIVYSITHHFVANSVVTLHFFSVLIVVSSPFLVSNDCCVEFWTMRSPLLLLHAVPVQLRFDDESAPIRHHYVNPRILLFSRWYCRIVGRMMLCSNATERPDDTEDADITSTHYRRRYISCHVADGRLWCETHHITQDESWAKRHS